MAQFTVRVIQVYRTERSLVLTINADSQDEAVENVASGSVDLLPFEDPAWTTSWDLQNEEVKIA